MLIQYYWISTASIVEEAYWWSMVKGGWLGDPQSFRLTCCFSLRQTKAVRGESGLDMLTTYMRKACAVAHRPPAPPHPVCFSRWCQRTRARQEEHEAAWLLFVIASVCIITRDRPLLLSTATVKVGKRAEQIPDMLRRYFRSCNWKSNLFFKSANRAAPSRTIQRKTAASYKENHTLVIDAQSTNNNSLLYIFNLH